MPYIDTSVMCEVNMISMFVLLTFGNESAMRTESINTNKLIHKEIKSRLNLISVSVCLPTSCLKRKIKI
jgi:hypothetical protein